MMTTAIKPKAILVYIWIEWGDSFVFFFIILRENCIEKGEKISEKYKKKN